MPSPERHVPVEATHGGARLDTIARASGDLALAQEIEGEWRSQRLLFVTGPHASGKSFAVRHSFDANSHAIFDLGPIMRQAHRRAAPDQTLGQWIRANEAEQGPDFTDALLARHIGRRLTRSEHPEGIILVGSRSIGGVHYLQNNLPHSDSRVVYLEAPRHLLYQRYCEREACPDMTPGQFDAILEAEVSMGLHEIRDHADMVLETTCELDVLKSQFRRYVELWTPDQAG